MHSKLKHVPSLFSIPLSAQGKADSTEIAQPPPLPKKSIVRCLEDECIDAFKLGNCTKAQQLLPQLTSPSKVQSLMKPPWWKGVPVLVNLVHVAAYNGWFDECVELITKYWCQFEPITGPRCNYSSYSAQHFAAYRGSLTIIRY